MATKEPKRVERLDYHPIKCYYPLPSPSTPTQVPVTLSFHPIFVHRPLWSSFIHSDSGRRSRQTRSLAVAGDVKNQLWISVLWWYARTSSVGSQCHSLHPRKEAQLCLNSVNKIPFLIAFILKKNLE